MALNRIKDYKKNYDLSNRIMSLPAELKLEILKWLNVEELVKLNLPAHTIRSIFRIPPEENAETWFANYVLKLNLGYIYIPRKNKIMINNHIGSKVMKQYIENKIDNEIQNMVEGQVKVLTVDTILQPGFYKFRVLLAGFDLCKADGSFISLQCGPIKCFSRELEEDWCASYLTRGYDLLINQNKRLAPSSKEVLDCQTTFSMGINCLGIDCDQFLDGPVFIISINNRYTRVKTMIEPLQNYSVDNLARKRREDYNIQLYVMKSIENNEVLAYIINSPSGFASYDPMGEFSLDEGRKNFFISRYKYRGSQSYFGLLISGLQDGYGLPSALNEVGLPFPDEETFKTIRYGKIYR